MGPLPELCPCSVEKEPCRTHALNTNSSLSPGIDFRQRVLEGTRLPQGTDQTSGWPRESRRQRTTITGRSSSLLVFIVRSTDGPNSHETGAQRLHSFINGRFLPFGSLGRSTAHTSSRRLSLAASISFQWPRLRRLPRSDAVSLALLGRCQKKSDQEAPLDLLGYIFTS